MLSWQKLEKEDRHRIWDRFYKDFHFRPSVYSKDWPSIHSQLPSLKFDIMECYREGYNEDNLLVLEDIAQSIFQSITKETDQMLALDWQHECFRFSPHQEIPRDPDFDEWLVPVLPNGDYYIFLTEDFKNMWFGHPWEESITVIGEEMVKATQSRLDQFDQIQLSIFH